MARNVHHKFVVTDFSLPTAKVFTGSCNFAVSGEQGNGDHLIMIEDRKIAIGYAVEALRIFDHLHFRNRMEESTGTPAAPEAPQAPGDHGRAIVVRVVLRCRFAAGEGSEAVLDVTAARFEGADSHCVSPLNGVKQRGHPERSEGSGCEGTGPSSAARSFASLRMTWGAMSGGLDVPHAMYAFFFRPLR